MARGKFITVEGIEGVGKTTNIAHLKRMIEARGYDVLVTREPGGTPIADRIRGILLEHGDEPLPDTAELLLFFASRSLHLENKIRPALEQGTWVVCDRFTDSSRAYQGIARGLGLERINNLAEWVHNGLDPDLTVLLDASPETGLSRAEDRGERDRMEAQQLGFFEKARNAFLALAKAEPHRFAIVDADGSVDEVKSRIENLDDRIFSDNKH